MCLADVDKCAFTVTDLTGLISVRRLHGSQPLLFCACVTVVDGNFVSALAVSTILAVIAIVAIAAGERQDCQQQPKDH
jgi:hypothetical protein